MRIERPSTEKSESREVDSETQKPTEEKPLPTAEEARAWDIQRKAQMFESDIADEAKSEEIHNRLNTPLEHRRREEDAGSYKLTRELAELTQGKRNDAVEIVAALSPQAQAASAEKFYKRTLDSSGINPSTEALATYQKYFKGTPFGERYKELVNEQFAIRGIHQDIDATNYGR